MVRGRTPSARWPPRPGPLCWPSQQHCRATEGPRGGCRDSPGDSQHLPGGRQLGRPPPWQLTSTCHWRPSATRHPSRTTHPAKPPRLLPGEPVRTHTTQTGWILARRQTKDQTGCKILQCPSRTYTSEVYETISKQLVKWSRMRQAIPNIHKP